MRRGLRADACAVYGSDTGTSRTGSWLPYQAGLATAWTTVRPSPAGSPVPGEAGPRDPVETQLVRSSPVPGEAGPQDPVETQLVRGSPVPGGARRPGLQRVAAEADVQGRGLESAS